MNVNLISLSIGILDIFMIIFCLRISKKIFPDDNINKYITKKGLINCMYMILGYIFIKNVFISNWMVHLHIGQSKKIVNIYTQQGDVINIIMICIQLVLIGPIIEELIFRGLILRKLLGKYNDNPSKAILYSAVVFGIIHFNILQSIVAFGGGIILGLIYYYTKSIKVSIFAHILNNFLVIIPNPTGILMNSIYLILGIYLIKKGNDKLKIDTIEVSKKIEGKNEKILKNS